MRKKIIGILICILLLIVAIIPCVGSTLKKEINDNIEIYHETLDNSKPSGRYSHAMVYDIKYDKVIMFGGYDDNGYNDETWVYDRAKNKWTNMNPHFLPDPRAGHAMAYIREFNLTILFGGVTRWDGVQYDTWVYHYNENLWVNMKPTESPQPRAYHAMAEWNYYVFLFGGYPADDLLWIYYYDHNNWASIEAKPSKYLMSHTLVADPVADEIYLFGGFGQGYYHDALYKFGNVEWEFIKVAPFRRAGHSMVYDSKHDIMVLFGGADDSGLHDDTWVYDIRSKTWTEMHPADKPSPRAYHAMVYDSKHDKTILFGGNTSNDESDELWEYDYDINNWKKLNPNKGKPVINDYITNLLEKICRNYSIFRWLENLSTY